MQQSYEYQSSLSLVCLPQTFVPAVRHLRGSSYPVCSSQKILVENLYALNQHTQVLINVAILCDAPEN
jgi:hypothetical protein